MQRTIDNWSEFRKSWDGVLNFLLAGECVPFSYNMPPIERLIEEVRRDDDAVIGSGARGRSLDTSDIADSFRRLPVEEALHSQFTLAHFKLGNFTGPGGLLEGFEEQVMEPWRQALTQNGFTWSRCYPILFISGPHCATNYHLDFSQVVAWQQYGTKIFKGLKDPQRWAPRETRIHSQGVLQPEGIGPEDVLAYEMTPGTALWNTFLTPHWVEASTTVACSFNISHGGLRLNGQLCRHEAEVHEWQTAHPEKPKLLF